MAKKPVLSILVNRSQLQDAIADLKKANELKDRLGAGKANIGGSVSGGRMPSNDQGSTGQELLFAVTELGNIVKTLGKELKGDREKKKKQFEEEKKEKKNSAAELQQAINRGRGAGILGLVSHSIGDITKSSSVGTLISRASPYVAVAAALGYGQYKIAKHAVEDSDKTAQNLSGRRNIAFSTGSSLNGLSALQSAWGNRLDVNNVLGVAGAATSNPALKSTLTSALGLKREDWKDTAVTTEKIIEKLPELYKRTTNPSAYFQALGIGNLTSIASQLSNTPKDELSQRKGVFSDVIKADRLNEGMAKKAQAYGDRNEERAEREFAIDLRKSVEVQMDAANKLHDAALDFKEATLNLTGGAERADLKAVSSSLEWGAHKYLDVTNGTSHPLSAVRRSFDEGNPHIHPERRNPFWNRSPAHQRKLRMEREESLKWENPKKSATDQYSNTGELLPSFGSEEHTHSLKESISQINASKRNSLHVHVDTLSGQQARVSAKT